jgi:hypothetical protein
VETIPLAHAAGATGEDRFLPEMGGGGDDVVVFHPFSSISSFFVIFASCSQKVGNGFTVLLEKNESISTL